MILAILQVRFSSSRLPGKALKSILGKPMLLHQIERLQQSQMIDKLIVATSEDISDDILEEMCIKNGIAVFRGSLFNVLDRFYQCAKTINPLHIVRLTGDCPLTDWTIIDSMIRYYLVKNLDYIATSKKLPDGLDAEIMTMRTLRDANIYATLPSEMEHVTQYIRKNADKFIIEYFDFDEDLSEFRWTVDEPEDFVFVKKVYELLYIKNIFFLTSDILKLLKKNPELTKINSHFLRNEGLVKSIRKDIKCIKNLNKH